MDNTYGRILMVDIVQPQLKATPCPQT